MNVFIYNNHIDNKKIKNKTLHVNGNYNAFIMKILRTLLNINGAENMNYYLRTLFWTIIVKGYYWSALLSSHWLVLSTALFISCVDNNSANAFYNIHVIVQNSVRGLYSYYGQVFISQSSEVTDNIFNFIQLCIYQNYKFLFTYTDVSLIHQYLNIINAWNVSYIFKLILLWVFLLLSLYEFACLLFEFHDCSLNCNKYIKLLLPVFVFITIYFDIVIFR